MLIAALTASMCDLIIYARYACPERYNPADYFIKITSVAGLDSEEQEKKRAEIEALCDAWEKNNWPQDPASPESAAVEKKTRSIICFCVFLL